MPLSSITSSVTHRSPSTRRPSFDVSDSAAARYRRHRRRYLKYRRADRQNAISVIKALPYTIAAESALS